jgi:capsid protein
MPRQQILDSRGNPIRSLDRGTRRIIRSRYDAASESNDTKRWWANADNLSARSANSPEVREKLRKRARYEAANGSYPAAIARTLAYDLIGTGPRLQVTTSDEGFNADVEARWREWVAAVRLPEKLRVMRRARAVDGESFGLLETNRNLQTPSKLDLRVIEADLVCDPFGFSPDPTSVDGIRLDRYGNPAAYYVMRQHPGDDMQIAGFGEYTTVPARLMIHWFRPDRPMQYRGVPEFTPALDLFAKLRRYTLAVIAAAEIAADYSAVLESDLLPNPNGEESEAIPAGEAFEVERGMMVTLPNGQKLKQLAAEQPTTTFEMSASSSRYASRSESPISWPRATMRTSISAPAGWAKRVITATSTSNAGRFPTSGSITSSRHGSRIWRPAAPSAMRPPDRSPIAGSGPDSRTSTPRPRRRRSPSSSRTA